MRSALVVVLGTAALSFALLGCAAADGSSQNAGRGDVSGGSSQERDGRTVGPAIAAAKLEPVGDFSTSGTAAVKGVGPTDVQLELDVSGLPKKSTDAGYYAQVHDGTCPEERSNEGHEQDEHGAASPALALLRFDRLAAEATGLQAHGGDEPGVPEEQPGSIEQPVTFGASPEGTISVVSLLEGVAPKRLTSGGPKYVRVRAVRPDAPSEELACGDLKVVKASG